MSLPTVIQQSITLPTVIHNSILQEWWEFRGRISTLVQDSQRHTSRDRYFQDPYTHRYRITGEGASGPGDDSPILSNAGWLYPLSE